jgi:hypothetical protein
LNRIVTHLPAVIRTAERIARERHGQVEGHDAAAFLQWVSPRSVMLLAMLADAAAEVLSFTRQCDTEAVDSAELPAHLSGLLTRIESLFCQGACVKVEACFAAALCKRIRTTRIMYYVDGVPRSLAEPSSDDLQHGLGVLTRWARMVSDTAAAEFPDFTVPAAFHIFSLAEKATQVCAPARTPWPSSGWRRSSKSAPFSLSRTWCVGGLSLNSFTRPRVVETRRRGPAR